MNTDTSAGSIFNNSFVCGYSSALSSNYLAGYTAIGYGASATASGVVAIGYLAGSTVKDQVPNAIYLPTNIPVISGDPEDIIELCYNRRTGQLGIRKEDAQHLGEKRKKLS